MKKEHLTIVKVGGAVVEDPSKFEEFLTSFTALQSHQMINFLFP